MAAAAGAVGRVGFSPYCGERRRGVRRRRAVRVAARTLEHRRGTLASPARARAAAARFSALQRLMPTCDGTAVRRCNSRSTLEQVVLRDVARMEPFVPFPSEPTDAADDSDDSGDSGEAEVWLHCPRFDRI
jgi:hypothetical protein